MRKVKQGGETARPIAGRKTFVLKITRIHSLSWVPPVNENPGKHPFFSKNIPYRYNPYKMKNMNKGITSSKVNKGLKAYKTKKIQGARNPFLVPLLRKWNKKTKGQKGRLGELRVAEDTK